MRDKYAIAKGKALTMIRESMVVYPLQDSSDLERRIIFEAERAIKGAINPETSEEKYTIMKRLVQELKEVIMKCEK